MISERSLYPLQSSFITVGPEEDTVKKNKKRKEEVNFDLISKVLLEMFTQPTIIKLSY